MSARKKASKSSTKKQEDSATKNKNTSLIAILKQKSSQYLENCQGGNITAELLEALLQKETGKLDSLLAQWAQDNEAVRFVADNLLQSKVPLFAQRVTELLQKDQAKIYLYPWIEEIYAKYQSKIEEEITERLRKSVIAESGETQKLIKMQGKLNLILQE